VGNIYADEALWRARIHPLTPAADLTKSEVQAVYRAIRRALEHGIARQGSTLRDYRLPDGASGSMQHEFKVYGRGGDPCDRCGTPIDKIRVAGRGTWYCPSCQRLPGYAASINSVSRPSPSSPPQLGVAADRAAADQDLRDRPAAGQLLQMCAELRVVVERYLLVLEPALVEQRLRPVAVAAPLRGVHLDRRHPQFKRRSAIRDSRYRL